MANGKKDKKYPLYTDEGHPMVEKSPVVRYVWDEVQKFLTGVIPNYGQAASGLEKSRKRITKPTEE